MTSEMSLREQLEAEVWGEKSKRTFEEKVKIVKFFLHNGEILFPYKSTSIVKCLFFLCDAYGEKQGVRPFYFTEVLNMVLFALGKYSGEFMMAENVCGMLKLIQNTSIRSSDYPVISNLIDTWLGWTKHLDVMDQFTFCFDVLKNLKIYNFTSTESFKNGSVVLNQVIAFLQDLAEEIDFGESAENFSNDEKEALVDIMCQLHHQHELLFMVLKRKDEFANLELKNCEYQLSLVLQHTLFKDVIAVLNGNKLNVEEDPLVVQKAKKDLTETITKTMYIFDYASGRSYIHACWVCELSSISEDRINPLPFLTNIVEKLVSSEASSVPSENDLKFRCQTLANVLVAFYDSFDNDRWSPEFKADHLRGSLTRAMGFLSFVKKQLGFTTDEFGKCIWVLDLLVPILLLDEKLVFESVPMARLIKITLQTGHKNLLAVTLHHFGRSRSLPKYFALQFFPVLESMISTAIDDRTDLVLFPQKTVLFDVYKKYFDVHKSIDLRLCIEFSLAFLQFWATHRKQLKGSVNCHNLYQTALYFIKVFLSSYSDDRLVIPSGMNASLAEFVEQFSSFVAHRKVELTHSDQEAHAHVLKLLKSVCSKYGLESEVKTLGELQEKLEIVDENLDESGNQGNYLERFLELHSSDADTESKNSGFKKIAKKLCKKGDFEQIVKLTASAEVFNEQHFQTLFFTELLNRNVDLMAFILAQEKSTQVFNFLLIDWSLLLNVVTQFELHEEVIHQVLLRYTKAGQCKIEPGVMIDLVSSLVCSQDDYHVISMVAKLILKTEGEEVGFLQDLIGELVQKIEHLRKANDSKHMELGKILTRFLCFLAVLYQHDVKALFSPNVGILLMKLVKGSDCFEVSFLGDSELDMLFHLFLDDTQVDLSTLPLNEIFTMFASPQVNANLLSLSYLLQLCRGIRQYQQACSSDKENSAKNTKVVLSIQNKEEIVTVFEKLVVSGLPRNLIVKVLTHFTGPDAKVLFFHYLTTRLLGKTVTGEQSSELAETDMMGSKENSGTRENVMTLLRILMSHTELRGQPDFCNMLVAHLARMEPDVEAWRKLTSIEILFLTAKQSKDFVSADYGLFLLQCLHLECNGPEMIQLLSCKLEILLWVLQKKHWLDNSGFSVTLSCIFQSLVICCSTCREDKKEDVAKIPKRVIKEPIVHRYHQIKMTRNLERKYFRRKKHSNRKQVRKAPPSMYEKEFFAALKLQKRSKRTHGFISKDQQLLNASSNVLISSQQRMEVKMKQIDNIVINGESCKDLIATWDKLRKLTHGIMDAKRCPAQCKLILSNMVISYVIAMRVFVVRREFAKIVSLFIAMILKSLKSSSYFAFIASNCTKEEKQNLVGLMKR